MARCVRQRVAGHVPRVAVGLAAIPERLDQGQQQRPLEAVGVGPVEHRAERVEVHAALHQQAVVHRAHVEHRAVEVRGHRGQRAPGDPALAVAVVEEAARVDQRALRVPEGQAGGKALRVHHRPPDVEEVQEALLEPVGQGRELGQVLQRAERVGEVVLRHPDPVGRAHEHVVLVAELLDVVGTHLPGVAEQAVAVQRRPRRMRRRGGTRDVADERRLVGVAGDALREPVRTEAEARPGRAAGLVEVARDGHVALDAPAYVRLLGRRVVDDLVDRVLGRRALHLQVAQVGVAELGEGAVADREHPSRQRALARHGEVPRQVEVLSLDPRPLEPPEDVLHVRAAALEGRIRRLGAVAVEAERERRVQQLAGARCASCAARRCSARPRGSSCPGGSAAPCSPASRRSSRAQPRSGAAGRCAR